MQERLDWVGMSFVRKVDLIDIPALVGLRRSGPCRSRLEMPEGQC